MKKFITLLTLCIAVLNVKSQVLDPYIMDNYTPDVITRLYSLVAKTNINSAKQIAIADIHRTIIDILDDPELGGGGRQVIDIVKEYFQKSDADPDVLCQYAEKLGNGAVFKRLGFIAEKIAHFSSELLVLETVNKQTKNRYLTILLLIFSRCLALLD